MTENYQPTNQGQQLMQQTNSGGAVAVAESAREMVKAKFFMAMQRPRDEDISRQRILNACKRLEFAERVKYKKPMGGSNFVSGPSIRFAEMAVQNWGNIDVDQFVIYEDEEIRQVKVICLDLESNFSSSKVLTVKKTVERKNKTGREVVGERINSSGDKVFIVKATDDEISIKEAALISKAIRNEGLRLIPADIIDEALAVAEETKRSKMSKDPKERLRKMFDKFQEIGISAKQIRKYLGSDKESLTEEEFQEMVDIFTAVESGEAKFSDFLQEKEPVKGSAEEINNRIKADQEKQKEDDLPFYDSKEEEEQKQAKTKNETYMDRFDKFIAKHQGKVQDTIGFEYKSYDAYNKAVLQMLKEKKVPISEKTMDAFEKEPKQFIDNFVEWFKE